MKELTPESRQETRNILLIYSWYRLLLSVLLLLMYLFGLAREVLGSSQGNLFLATTILYFLISLVFHLWFKLRESSFNQVKLLLFYLIESAIIFTLAFSSGGVQSGLGYLSMITLASATVVLHPQLAYLLAAITTIAFLSSAFGNPFNNRDIAQDIFSAGVLGILLFLTVSLFQYLAQRIKRTQSLAEASAAEAADLQQLNENIVKKMRTGILVVDEDQRIRLINNAARQLLGGDEDWTEIAAGQHLNTLPGLAKQYIRWKSYPWLRTPSFKNAQSGPEIQANFSDLGSGNRRQVLIFLEDVRSLSQHAQQLKLSALGRLTGSIAHEIRNPLGAISHAAQLLNEAEANNANSRLTEIILRHSERVDQIVKNILSLSSQNTPQFQKVLLQHWLDRFCNEFHDSQRQDCEIELENLSGDFQITFDPTHLGQILTNLIENALKYSRAKSGKSWVKIVTGLDKAGFPFLHVYDRGPGVDEELQDKIFEPFFTTSHEGSGLGLYLSRELCITNYATLNYVQENGTGHYFKLGFAHPDQLLPRNDS